ncbi:hypothetical protein BDFB_009711 [Asbolus verrucosus]|uniref:RUN domain-containing protein n=1 Tax=Asbolus verrucosus TaxID=1661398 RepID=A0A482VJB2_ASBVE|nr:hypothetical protein BDFB_009711 [Asbolus verrucosus]
MEGTRNEICPEEQPTEERWDPLGAPNDHEEEKNVVQFRLRQVVNAPLEDKEELLKSLEEFAFRGIPDISLVKERMDEASLAEAVRLRRSQQKELIDRLKSQLRELEQYAFENGEAGVPQDVVLERQRVILNELKTRMNLEIDERNYHQVCNINYN